MTVKRRKSGFPAKRGGKNQGLTLEKYRRRGGGKTASTKQRDNKPKEKLK